MLPTLHRQSYLEFKQALQQLHKIVTSESLESTALKTAWTQVQEYFGNQIISLENDPLDPLVVSRVQSYLTEIHKQLRLLGMDVTFWQGTRQPETAKARQLQMGDRIQILIRYCDTLLN